MDCHGLNSTISISNYNITLHHAAVRMMNVYHLQKINKLITNDFVRNAAFWLLYVLNRRFLVVHFDPVLACNLRCRSCYFSDDERRKELKGVFKQEDLPRIADAIFNKALKLQIGCGAEPTLFKYNSELIRLAKSKGISYVSFTSNANLLDRQEIVSLLDAGLNEFTISLHGVRKETYEYLMPNASFEKLKEVLGIISEVKGLYPNFKLRLNFTVSNYNVVELASFFESFGDIDFDILQLRVLRDIGGEIKSIETDSIFVAALENAMETLRTTCKNRGVLLIEPEGLEGAITQDVESDTANPSYCYISPRSFYENDFDWRNENINDYTRRKKFGRMLLKKAFVG